MASNNFVKITTYGHQSSQTYDVNINDISVITGTDIYMRCGLKLNGCSWDDIKKIRNLLGLEN